MSGKRTNGPPPASPDDPRPLSCPGRGRGWGRGALTESAAMSVLPARPLPPAAPGERRHEIWCCGTSVRRGSTAANKEKNNKKTKTSPAWRSAGHREAFPGSQVRSTARKIAPPLARNAQSRNVNRPRNRSARPAGRRPDGFRGLCPPPSSWSRFHFQLGLARRRWGLGPALLDPSPASHRASIDEFDLRLGLRPREQTSHSGIVGCGSAIVGDKSQTRLSSLCLSPSDFPSSEARAAHPGQRPPRRRPSAKWDGSPLRTARGTRAAPVGRDPDAWCSPHGSEKIKTPPAGSSVGPLQKIRTARGTPASTVPDQAAPASPPTHPGCGKGWIVVGPWSPFRTRRPPPGAVPLASRTPPWKSRENVCPRPTPEMCLDCSLSPVDQVWAYDPYAGAGLAAIPTPFSV